MGATTQESFAPGGGSPNSGPNKKGASVNLYDPYDKTQLDNINSFWALLQAIFAVSLLLVFTIGLFLI